MIKFSFLPLKKLSTVQIEEHRFDVEEVISLNSVEDLKLLLGMFGSTLSSSELNNISGVSNVWIIDKKLKPQDEASIDSFYNQWLAKSKRDNDFGEFCQLVSFNSFIAVLNKGKFNVVLALADQ
ncbi:hypothetical protein ACMAZF_06135 [Psychrobium sp. nBUS_13]|uniref:hypothetical protein n=1 Tax=Psychrobium sp. nBUS_13 TaxID=3395319 RepID=UPI003EC0F247